MSTLRDVAARARVSIKTASRVVNGEDRVAPGTEARVRRAVRALGYVPNVAARRLVRRRAFVLGVVYQNKSWNWLNDFQRGAIDEARAHGYEILMHPCDLRERGERDQLLRTLDQGSVDGLVLTPPCCDFGAVTDALETRSAAYVRIAPTDRRGVPPSVSASDREGAREMGAYLLSLGHRRFAFVAGEPEQRSSHDREAGFRDALSGHGVAWSGSVRFQGDFSFESGVAVGREILGCQPRPTAVFASNDDMAAGLLSVFHEQGVAVPGEISVAGFDDVALAHQVWPPLTTVHQPTAEIASLATRLLVDVLDGGAPSVPHPVLSTRLAIRASTGAPCT